MKINLLPLGPKTHEGGQGQRTTAEQELRRLVSACLLWEPTFYEPGEAAAGRIADVASRVRPEFVRDLALDARSRLKLRHVPLLLLATLAERGGLAASTVASVIQRPDELAELLAIYWRAGKKPLKQAIKKGMAEAFRRFDEYALAKYDRPGSVRLRDCLFLCHAKPKNQEQAELWKRLIAGTMTTPDTWEVTLSSRDGTDKLVKWERLLAENRLGAMALMRNLRNMIEAGVSLSTLSTAITDMTIDRVLPYRFIAAARYATQLEPVLEQAMFKCLSTHPLLDHDTVLLIDVSGSMDSVLSGKSDMTRIDAASALAILVREIASNVQVFTFSNHLVEVPPRRGFALRDAIKASQPHAGTKLGKALSSLDLMNLRGVRLIVITDEQTQDSVPAVSAKPAYIVNVATYQTGVAYDKFVHVHGWSEAIIDFIIESEQIDTSGRDKEQQLAVPAPASESARAQGLILVEQQERAKS